MATALVMLSVTVLLGFLLPSSMADNVLYAGDTLYAGQSLTQGGYTFIIQSDCNLVLYDNGRAVWASGTNGRGGNCVLRMQNDGNLVVYDGNNNNPVWASNTSGSQGNFVLILQRDRNVVIYSCPTWATGTNTANSEGVVIVKSGLNDTSFAPVVVAPTADEPTNRKIAMVINN